MFQVVEVQSGEVLQTVDTGAGAALVADCLNDAWRLEGSERRARVKRVTVAAPAPPADTGSPAPEPDPAVIYPDCLCCGPFGPDTWRGELSQCVGNPESIYGHTARFGPVTAAHAVPASGYGWRSARYHATVGEAVAQIPWARESWWHTSPHFLMHYPSVSAVDNSQISFTPSEEHGLADRQLRMRPGRYLSRYFGDVLSADEIERWALAFATANAPVTVLFARDADTIQRVYETGPSSCMSHRASSYAGSVHPTRVYAGPDLALAYCEGKGAPTARAVVWPAEKVYTTIYGDVARLKAGLEALGYEYNSLEGARIRRIPDGAGFVIPYIDGLSGGAHDDGEYLILGTGEIETDRTDGLSSGEDSCSCEHCGNRCAEEDTTYVESRNETWCDACADRCLDRCVACRDLRPTEDLYRGPDGAYRCEECHDEAVTACDGCSEDTMHEDLQEGPDGEYRCAECHEDATVECAQCDTRVMTDAKRDPDGDPICEACRFSTCDTCQDCSAEGWADTLRQNGGCCTACLQLTLPLPQPEGVSVAA